MSRGEQIAAERRRRNTDALSGTRKRLSVDESKLDRKNYEYRFINDMGDRVKQLTVHDDWDIVTDRDGELRPSDGSGSEVAVSAGTGERGAPLRAVLVRKPKKLYNDDYAALQRRIDDQEKAMGADRGNANNYTPGDAPVMRVSVDK